MLAHESLVENLVDFIIWRPLVTNNMVSDGFNKLIVNVVASSLILDIRIRIRTNTFSIINLHKSIISS